MGSQSEELSNFRGSDTQRHARTRTRKKKQGPAFDTELINSTIDLHGNEVDFYLSPGLVGFDIIRGIPISVDPHFVKIELSTDYTTKLVAGSEVWINRGSIIACRIYRDDSDEEDL